MLFLEALILSLPPINKNTLSVALRCVTFFSHTSEPVRTINTFVNVFQFFSHKRASNYITDNQYFSLLMF